MFRLITPNGGDKVDATYLRDLPRTELLGRRHFPTVTAYHRAVRGQMGATGDPRHYVAAQRDWHMRGQNGCQFARLAAKDAGTLRWDYLVCDGTSGQLTPAQIAEIDDHVMGAIKRDDTQMLSLLVPDVLTPRDAVNVIRQLTTLSGFWLEHDQEVTTSTGKGLALHLRYPVEASQAWVVAFGPFACVTNTRRSPYFELAVRTKEKPATVHASLNQEKGLAHLADISLGMMPERHWSHRLKTTVESTARLLGTKVPEISAAKVTLFVPSTELDS